MVVIARNHGIKERRGFVMTEWQWAIGRRRKTLPKCQIVARPSSWPCLHGSTNLPFFPQSLMPLYHFFWAPEVDEKRDMMQNLSRWWKPSVCPDQPVLCVICKVSDWIRLLELALQKSMLIDGFLQRAREYPYITQNPPAAGNTGANLIAKRIFRWYTITRLQPLVREAMSVHEYRSQVFRNKSLHDSML
ncbi:hypothetical protein HBI38_007220 [Parastagonospora nodorum]|nr:hypothetical protein HBI73_006570 [Parastagonospora nodorum]KAH6333303.1 hypothetical protein HBI38_007220 [Parastagonospora nodorum]